MFMALVKMISYDNTKCALLGIPLLMGWGISSNSFSKGGTNGVWWIRSVKCKLRNLGQEG